MRTIKLSIIFMLALIISIFSPEYSNANPLENWHWRNLLPQGNALNSVTYGNGTYVALGQSDTILTPPNGVALLKAQNFIPENLVGYIRTLAIDEMDKTTGSLKGRLVHYLNTEDGKLYEIEDSKRVLKIRPSEKVSLSGIKKGNKIIVDEVTLHHVDSKSGLEANIMAGPQPETIGEQRTLVALFNYPDKPDQPFPLQEIQDKIINNADSVDNFIRENSYGKTWFNADFIDWQTLPNNSTYYGSNSWEPDLLFDAINTIDSVVDFRKYARLIFIYVNSDTFYLCGMGGNGKFSLNSPRYGSFSASMAWIGESCNSSVVISHEFGHNLGFSHASSILTIPESLLDPIYSGGRWDEYGDSDDTMGEAASVSYRHFSSIWKSQAQWIESNQIQEVISSGEYIIDQIEVPSPGIKTLKILLGKDLYDNDFYYWIEYRRDLGAFDKENNVEVRAKQSATYAFCPWDSLGWCWNHSMRFENPSVGGSISGRVTRDSDGVGIENVLIDLYDASWNWVYYDYTDISGNYRVVGLPPGNYYLKTVNNQCIDEYYNNVTSRSGATPVSVTQGSNTLNINFSLALGGSISGRVTRDSDGRGIENVQIDVYNTTSPNPVRIAYSDSSGNYRAGGLPTGSYYLKTQNNQSYIDEYYDNVNSRSGATPVGVTQGSNTPNINFSLALGGSISGRVTRHSDGAGIKNAWIDVCDVGWNAVKTDFVDSSGNYRVGGLPTGRYYLKTGNNQGYADEYFDNVTSWSAATLVSVIQGLDTPNINFSLALGGSISGRVTRDSDGAGIENVFIALYDASWNWVYYDYDYTDISGNYRVVRLPPGNYYLRTENSSQGYIYIDGYFDNVTTRGAATLVSVIQGIDTPNINFSLALAGSVSGRVTRDSDGGEMLSVQLDSSHVSWNHTDSGRTASSYNYIAKRHLTNSYQEVGITDIDANKPFHDPYRGVKVEMIEKTGTGSDSKTRLRVTLSGIIISPADNLNFGEVNLNNPSSREVGVMNNSATSIATGTISVTGRDSGLFIITTDNCSNKNLLPGENCTLILSFSPNSGGEKFGVLVVPTNDSIKPKGTVTLYGKSIIPLETISAPVGVGGPTGGTVGTSYDYSTGGSTSNLGHDVQYFFDWGDQTNSGWLPVGTISASHSWITSGTYLVKAQARCATDTNVISNWSGSLSVTISSATLSYTVTTNPIGLQVTVDGSTYIAPQTFNWTLGSSHTISATSPQDGPSATRYVYSSWSDGGARTHTITAPSSSTTYTATFSTQYELTITSSPLGGGTVNPSPMGDQSRIACIALVGVICAGYYPSGTLVTLAATPNTGYTFSGWSGDLSGTANPTSVTMNGPKNLVANFTQNQYTLTVNIAPPGSGSVFKNPDKATYTYGQQVQLTTTANPGYTFNNWSGDATGSSNSVTVTIDGNKTVTANFTELIGPDLTGSWTTPVSQTCKSTKKGPKCTITGTLTVKNIGSRDASSSTVKFYLSDDDTYDQSDTPLKSSITGKIKAGQSKTIKLTYNFPVEQIVTNKYIIAVIDKYNVVKEIDEANNIIVFGPIQ